MMPNRTYELRNLYFQQSQYSVNSEDQQDNYPPLLKLPENGYQTFTVDTDLLQQALAPSSDYPVPSLSQQVFGQELKKQQINLEHSANLFQERGRLNKQHLQDIDHRHMQVQEKLYGAWINHTQDRSKRLGNLEGQLLQLEQSRREEELSFWKDTVELREQLFETASEYRNTRNRYNIFSGVGVNYG